MLAQSAPKPHPVRKVSDLLCSEPTSLPRKRSRVIIRGLRGRFIERVERQKISMSMQGSPVHIAKRPYKKYYSNPTPSSHCHVCARTSKSVRFAVCSRSTQGLCRKVVCNKCFSKFGWDWDVAVGDRNWECVHCRGVCPAGRSQCFIYSRVNRQRETKRRVSDATNVTVDQVSAQCFTKNPTGSGLPFVEPLTLIAGPIDTFAAKTKVVASEEMQGSGSLFHNQQQHPVQMYDLQSAYIEQRRLLLSPLVGRPDGP